MTDEEFRRRCLKIAGKKVDVPMYKETPYTERSDNPTPSGGDYSIAYFYDKNGRPCTKNNAVRVNIVEYKSGGIRINETYAKLV